MEAIAPVILGAIAPLHERIAALEARPIEGKPGVDGKDGAPGDRGEAGPAGERGTDGTPGRDGIDGRDAQPVTGEEIASALRAMPELAQLVVTAVTDNLIANPPRAGERGEKGDKGDKGDPARDGRDGLPGVPGAPGEKGIDGKDGLGIDDYDYYLDEDGRTEVRQWRRGGEVVKEKRLKHTWPLYRKLWQAKGYSEGDIVTWGNESWIAIADNSDKPPSDAWQLMARKGRDSKEVERPMPNPGPVKFR